MAKAKQQPDPQTGREAGFVTIRIPFCELTDEGGYQISKRNPPREIRQRRLSEAQGRALARIRLGFLSHSACLEPDVFNGHSRPVDSKEDVLAKLLELIGDAISEAKR